MHNKLKQQLETFFRNPAGQSDELNNFLAAVDKAYSNFDEEKGSLDRANSLQKDELLKFHERIASDSGEKLRIEKALLESESRYRLLVEISPDAILVYSDGRILFVNAAGARMFLAQSAGDMVGRPLLDFVHPDYYALVEETLRVLEQGESIPLLEEKCIRTDGTEFMAELTAVPFTYENKQAIFAVLRDVSERKNFSDLLRKIAATVSLFTGYEFYRSLVEQLANVLDKETAFIIAAENPDEKKYRIVCMHRQGNLVEDISLNIQGTPLEQAAEKTGFCVFPSRLGENFPNSSALAEGMDSYLSVPLLDSRKKITGHIGVMSGSPLKDYSSVLPILQIFASRTSAEFERIHDEQKIQDSEKSYRTLTEQAAEGIIVLDAAGRLLEVSNKAAKMLGYSREKFLRKNYADLPEKDVRFSLWRNLQKLKTKGSLQERRNFRRKDGSVLPVEINVAMLDDGRMQAFVRDITDTIVVERERESYMETLAMLEEVIVELDETLVIQRLSHEWDKLLYNGESPVGRTLENLTHLDYQYYINQNLFYLITEKKSKVVLQFPIPRPNGLNFWLEGKFLPIYQDRTIKGVRGVLRDVTLDHLTEKQINFYAYHDNLTGLPNRTRMEENLYRALIRAERDNNRVAVGFIDLDNFYQINNFLGHKVGDRVLLMISENLSEVLGSGERLFRWGGDQFVVILSEVSDFKTVRETGERMINAAKTPVRIDTEMIHVTFSIGFAVYPDDGLTAEDLLGQADRALVYAKSQGRFNFQLSKDIPEKGYYKDQIAFRNKVALAIRQNEIKAFFQPKVEAKTHKIIGMEALARWPGPDGVFRATPATFIPIAENIGLIADMGDQILKQSLELLKKTSLMGRKLNMAVNVSRRQLFGSEFIDRTLQLAYESGFAPSDLTLEITESIAMLDVDYAPERLKDLHNLGFKLSIDDFGTGYSSLSQLHEMPVDELKVDISFVRRIHTNEGLQIVQAIINIGQALDLKVVAEGVEDIITIKRLEELGVSYLQGYYFSPAVSAEDFLKLLLNEEVKK